jgi:GR25 family glycosyltransferase involved in LPS biosynthesis
MNNLLNIPIYYINLKKDIDRDLYMKNHLLELNFLNYYRVEAVNGKEYEEINGLSQAEIGCVMSHIKALEYFLSSNNEIAIICEDDADFSNFSNFDLRYLKHDNLKNFCLQTSVICREEHLIDFNIHKRSFWDFGCSSYIINRTYAKTLIEHYGNHLNLNFNKFYSKKIEDTRGGFLYTMPVAENIIYSLTKVFCYPIFTFKNFSSTINNSGEQSVQIKTSIEKFKNYWSTE